VDDRTYIRLHDGMPDHPKVVGLSNAAFRLYVESLCWCSRHLTDGVIPMPALKRLGGWSPAALKEIIAATLYENGNGSGWIIHDYTEHQRTADDVATMKEAKRLAGVTGNHERWHVARHLRDPACELCAIDDASHVRSIGDGTAESQVRSGSDRKSSPDTETDTEGKKKTLGQTGSDQDPDFCAFWAPYPRKVAKGQARKAWRAAILGRRENAKTVIAASEEFGAYHRARRTDQQYIPHPATWLNGECYNDALPAGGDDDNDGLWDE
jgi:hypothetical protein